MTFWPRYVIGRPGSSSWSLAAAIRLPVNVSPPTTTSKSSAVSVTRLELALVAEVLRDADQARRQRPQRVRQRGALRHGGHRDAEPQRAADHGADREAERDPAVV